MTKPSFQDYGTYDESAYPELWDGVVGYWAPCLGPTGTRLFDVSRFHNWGTLTNMDAATDWVIDGGQYALDFDGTNDYVGCGTASVLNPRIITYSAWIKPNAQSNSYNQIMGWDAGGSVTVVSTMLLKSNLKLAWYVAGGPYGTYDGNGTYTLSTGKWQHIVMLCGPAAAQGYVDGNLDLSVSGGTASQGAGEFWIAGQNGYASRYFNGQIADVVVWNRALTANEIRSLYNLGRGGMLERRRRRRVYSVKDTGNRRRRIICGAEC